jgi:hypothetical protein
MKQRSLAMKQQCGDESTAMTTFFHHSGVSTALMRRHACESKDRRFEIGTTAGRVGVPKIHDRPSPNAQFTIEKKLSYRVIKTTTQK